MINEMSLRDILQQHQNIDRLDVELIIAHVLKKGREFVLSHPEYIPTQQEHQTIIDFLKRRESHEPIAYILGHREFFGLDFKVTKDTLIPRPETELMVEQVLHVINQIQVRNSSKKESMVSIVDVGTGSGNIIITIAKQIISKKNSSHFSLHGIDISSEALSIAKENAKLLEVNSLVTFSHSNLLQDFNIDTLALTDHVIITANLPYLSQDIYQSSIDDVKKYEPKTALFSEENGLRHYKELLHQLSNFSKQFPNIKLHLFFEISPEQKNSIIQLIQKYYPNTNVTVEKDLASKYRLAIVSKYFQER